MGLSDAEIKEQAQLPEAVSFTFSGASRPKVSAIVDGGKAKRRPRFHAPRQVLALQGQAKWPHRPRGSHRACPSHPTWNALPGRRRGFGGVWLRGRRFALPPSTMADACGVDASTYFHRKTAKNHISVCNCLRICRLHKCCHVATLFWSPSLVQTAASPEE